MSFKDKQKQSEYNRQYRLANLAKMRRKNAEYREQHRDFILLRRKGYRLENRDEILAKHAAWREQNKHKIKDYRTQTKEEIKARSLKWRSSLIGWAKSAIMRCRKRGKSVKRRNMLVTIDYDFLVSLWHKQNGMCAYLNEPMTLELSNPPKHDKVSVDRIDPNGGYTPDNVRLVWHWINIARMCMADQQLDILIALAHDRRR